MKYQYSKIVRESLIDDSFYENQLYESLNEGFDLEHIKNVISKVKDKKKTAGNLIKKFNKENNLNTKKYIGIALIMIYLFSFMAKNNKWEDSHNYKRNIDKGAAELVSQADISVENVVKVTKHIMEIPEVKVTPIFSLGAAGLITSINSVVPDRLSKEKIPRYDKYDKDILKAVNNLKAKDENPDADLIKAIMIIETGMHPRKNSLGFEGFPQTKKHIINGWKDKKGVFHPGINQKYDTNFTIEDMYNAEKAAEFIYYYTKSLKKSKYVKTTEDIIIAYNWGVGNLGKYKNGKEKLPKQSKDYVEMIKILQKYFS